MATDSDAKLTKFESTVTVVTADFANSMFGGLYGTSRGDSLDDGAGAGADGAQDPRVRGHIHDGEHADGHVRRVDLVEHVESRLTWPNLGENAVHVDQVYDSTDVTNHIPEYKIHDGTEVDSNGATIPAGTRYYLDLRIIRSDFTFHEVEEPASAGPLSSVYLSEHRLIRQRDDDEADPSSWDDDYGYDFVFGSDSLEDKESPDNYGDNRFQFDKSIGAFRAGSVDADQWDADNRGDYSTAFGRNNTASGSGSTISGGSANTATDNNTTVGGGFNSNATAIRATVSGGHTNNAEASGATVGGGYINTADGIQSTVSGGTSNIASGINATVGGGGSNEALGDATTIGGGGTNVVSGSESTIGGGVSNSTDCDLATIAGGTGNHVFDDSSASTIGGGEGNYIGVEVHDAGVTAACTHSTIAGGSSNKVIDGSIYSFIGGGEDNDIGQDNADSTPSSGPIVAAPCTHSVIGGGSDNNILDSSAYSFIGGGQNNDIGTFDAEQPVTHSVVSGGGNNNIYEASLFSVIGGGEGNDIYGASTHAMIGGGEDNNIYTTGSDSVHSTIGGGSGNNITAPGSTIAGGVSNTCGGDNSVIGGGSGNTVSQPRSTIAGGKDNVTNSGDSFIGGGRKNNIGPSSSYSIICGGGGENPGERNTINENISTLHMGGSASASPSDVSGVFGGKGNQINGGKDPSWGGYVPVRTQNYIFSGNTNHITGTDLADGGAAAYCSISFGMNNEIVAGAQQIIQCYIGSGSGNLIHNPQTDTINNSSIIVGNNNLIRAGVGGGDGAIESCVIVSGSEGRMLTHNSPGTLDYCTILGGYSNAFDSGYWASTPTVPGGAGRGAQTSAILGGSQNNITTSDGEIFEQTTVFSTIVGGFVNKINGSRGSVICGGGSLLDPASPEMAPYVPLGAPGSAQAQGGNEISGSHYSGILSGSANIINQSPSSAITHGRQNDIQKSENGYGVNYALAGGKLSRSYTYGQSSQASGAFDLGDAIFAAHEAGGDTTYDESGAGAPGLYGGGPGSAQAFTITMFGHWEYRDPATAAGQAFPCYLDGYDETTIPGKRFVPRDNSSYAFTIQCTLNCTAVGLTAMHTAAFTYRGGLRCDWDGAFIYGCTNDVEENFSTGPIVSNGGGVASPDFYVYFTHDGLGPSSVSGDATAPTNFGLYMHVENITGAYIGESLVARIDVTESRLHYIGA